MRRAALQVRGNRPVVVGSVVGVDISTRPLDIWQLLLRR
jgi:hypothetical protein